MTLILTPFRKLCCRLPLLAGLLLCYVAPARVCSAQTAAAGTAANVLPGTLVLRLKAGPQAAPADLRDVPGLQPVLQQLKVTSASRKFPRHQPPVGDRPGLVDLTHIYELTFAAAVPVEVAAQKLLRTGLLAYVEPLRQYPLLFEPNDPRADSSGGSQYHLRKIRAYQGWSIERGDTSVLIGVLDTGIKYDHPDLEGNLQFNYADPINGTDDDNDGYPDNYRGWDFSNNDNDATTPTNNGHGVPVTGVVSATTNNGIGVAGVGFNCRYLPLKVYPSGAGTGRFMGYEGIVYAADHGCDVINLSWGDAIPASAFEQEIINYAAINHDVVVVAAAGNTNDLLDFFPASYDNVLSVGTTDSLGQKAPANTYSYKIDLVAPGVNIWTTVRNTNLYGTLSGSSFACPQVAGAAALVRSKWPNLTAQQVAEQVRVTADQSILNLPANQAFRDRLGRGWLNVYAALSQPQAISVRNVAKNLDDQRPLYIGDTVSLTGTFRNFLSPAQNVEVRLRTSSAHIRLLDSVVTLGNMATLANATNNSTPFRFVVLPGAAANELARLKFVFTAASGYTDYQYFELFLNPEYVTLNVNKLAVTVSPKGTFGYHGNNTAQGVGVRYKNSRSLLSEGGLMVAASPSKVSNAVRSQSGMHNEHFFAQQPMRFRTPLHADQEAFGMMQDSMPHLNTVGLEISQTAYAWQQAPNDKFVVLEYEITNVSGSALSSVYAGLFADWDLWFYSRNEAGYDAGNKLGYVLSKDSSNKAAGISLLSRQTPAYYALNNFAPTTPAVNLTDTLGFTLAEKFTTLFSGIGNAAVGTGPAGTDVAHVLGGDLGGLLPNETAKIAFAILAGDGLADLQQSAAAAQTQYQTILSQRPATSMTELRLYPNPANGRLQLDFGPAGAAMAGTAEVRNLLGQVVLRQPVPAGAASASFATHSLRNGVYLVRLVSADKVVQQQFVVQH